MTEHSPIPWSIESSPYDPDTINMIRDSAGNIVAIANINEDISIKDVDAAFLIRAVNSYYTLVDLIEVIESIDLQIDTSKFRLWVQERLEAARTAIINH